MTLGDGIAIAAICVPCGGAVIVYLLTRERKAADVEARVDASADASQRLDKWHERDVQRIEHAIEASEQRTAKRLDTIDEEIVRLRERQHELVSRFQAVAMHTEGLEQLERRVALLERRSPPPVPRTGSGA